MREGLSHARLQMGVIRRLMLLHFIVHHVVLASSTNLTFEQLHTAILTSGVATVPGRITFESVLTLPVGHNATIRGISEQAILDGNNRTALFAVDGLLRLEKVTIQGGTGTLGGAIYVGPSGSVELSECTATLNQATFGAVVYSDHGSVLVSGGSYFNNVASTDGGVIYNNRGSVFFHDVLCHFNIAESKGGVVYNSYGTLHFDGGRLFNNVASADGGVAYIDNGSVLLENGIFHHNSAIAKGGVLYSSHGTLRFVGGEFYQNQATSAGGVGYNIGGSSMLIGTVFSHNKVLYDGGVFANVEHVGYAENVTWHGNEARYRKERSRGGALSNIRCTDYRIVHCRGEFNSVPHGDGGCFYFEEGSYHIRGGFYQRNNAKFGGVFADSNAWEGEMVDSRCESNRAGNGGCISYTNSIGPSIKNGHFRNNNASNGGIIAVERIVSEIVIAGGIFEDSYTTKSGGFIYAVSSRQVPCLDIADATFINGNSLDRGGVVFATCSMFATNSSFLASSAWSGGALFVGDGQCHCWAIGRKQCPRIMCRCP